MAAKQRELRKDGKPLLEAIDPGVLSNLMEGFANSQRIGAGIFTADMVRIVSGSNHSAFCRLIREAKKGKAIGDMECEACDRKHFPRTNKATRLYPCHAGIYDFNVPIVTSKDVLIGAIFGGQVLKRRLSQDDFLVLRDVARKYGIPECKLFEAAASLPIMTEEDEDRVLELTKGISAFIADLVEKRANEHEFLLKLTGTSELSLLSGHAIAYVKQVLQVTSCSIFLRETVGGKTQFVLKSTSSRTLKRLVNRSGYSLGEGLTGWVAKYGRSLCLQNVRSRKELAEITPTPRWAGKLRETPDYSAAPRYLGIPLISGKTVLGVIRVVASKTRRPLDESDTATLEGLAKLLVNTIDSAETREEVRRRSEDFEALGNAARSVNSSLLPSEVLDDIITLGLQVMNRTAGNISMYILLHDPAARNFLIMRGAGKGYSKSYIGSRFPDTHGIAGHVYREGLHYYICNDVTSDRHYEPIVKNTAAVIAAPIVSDEDFFGVLSFLSSDPGVFSEEDAHLLRGFAQHVSIALKNSLAYVRDSARVELQRDTADAITKNEGPSGVCRAIGKIAAARLAASACSVFLSDEWGRLVLAWSSDTDLMQRQLERKDIVYRIGEGLTGWTATLKAGDILRLDDITDKTSLRRKGRMLTWENKFPESLPPTIRHKAFIGAPFYFRDQLLGVIRLAQRETSETFLSEDEVVLRELAAQGSISLRFARAIEEREFATKGFAHDAGVPVDVLYQGLWNKHNITRYALADERLAIMYRHAEHLRFLLNAYRLIGGEAIDSVEIEKIEVRPMVARVLEIAFGSYGQRREQWKVVNAVPEGAIVYADLGKLYLILLNLAKNAVAAANGYVCIGWRERLKYWEFDVSDNGPGIDASVIPSEISPEHLGLSITRTFVEAHGGRITFHKRHKKESGALVRVRIPKASGG